MLAPITDAISPMPIRNAAQLMTWNVRKMRLAILVPINRLPTATSTLEARPANDIRCRNTARAVATVPKSTID